MMVGTRLLGTGALGMVKTCLATAVCIAVVSCCGCGGGAAKGTVAKSEGSTVPPMRPKAMSGGGQSGPAAQAPGGPPARTGGPAVAAPIETP